MPYTGGHPKSCRPIFTHTIPDSIARFQVSDDEYYEEASYPDSAVGLSELGTPTQDSSFVPKEREFINPEISEVADSSSSQVSELGQGLTAITTKNNEGEKQIPDPKEYQTESATIQAPVVRAHSSLTANEKKPEESPRKRGWKTNPSHQPNHSQPDVETVVQKRLAAAKKDWEAEAEAAAQEWRKKVEELAQLNAEIGARSKLESERKALDEARLAEEIKIKEEEAMKKRYLEEAMVIAEKKLKKTEKPPLKFKDAVGRKFSFPFHICQTWQGMEELIKQAFLHVDVIGPHVQEGHYDLIGPNGEIILPSIWEKVIEPDWAVTMHMWPLDKAPPIRPPFGRPVGMPPPPGMHSHPGQRPNMHGPPRPSHLPLGVQNQPRPGGAQHGGMPQFPAQRPHGGIPKFTGHQSHGVRFPMVIEARPESIYSTTKPRFASLRRWIPSRLKRFGRSESDASSIITVSSSGS
ncbi:hypothetical protein B0T24DRAFT_632140 [Lasiosphaeria ovina]|uniref:Ubiquitin-like domain-containing protein n=1 Tax=Lasiosphaeria ovina TaxID=92902 RepID=A0AAE0K374_9PEZI|nr:hypothetical protein B0T24DRAFT_632140 [Lasiosphaeria ovina]